MARPRPHGCRYRPLTFGITLLTATTIALWVAPTHASIPAGFIENRGQIDEHVRYYASGARASIHFTSEAIVLDLHEEAPGPALADESLHAFQPRLPDQEELGRSTRRACAVRICFEGANPSPIIDACDEQATRYHYFLGADRERWQTDVPAYAEITYRDLWPGIDLVYRVDAGGIHYELMVDPGTDPQAAEFRYEGAEEVTSTGAGEYLIKTPVGALRDVRPANGLRTGKLIWDESDNEKTADGIRVAGAPLRDDGLTWSTFLGGGGLDDGYAVTVYPDGSSVTTGRTGSVDFPTTVGAYSDSINGLHDVFVSKLDATGSTLLWSTFLGGSHWEVGFGIDTDTDGNPVFAGGTLSDNFPTTAAAYDTSRAGDWDVFVAKLDTSGSSLLWSTLVGADDLDLAFAIALDADDNPVLSGATRSDEFPVTAGAYDESFNGGASDSSDIFVTKLDAEGESLLWSSFLGGGGNEEGLDIALDPSANVVVVGYTTSTDFPTIAGAHQEVYGGGETDCFVATLTTSGDVLLSSTYLGGNALDYGYAVVLDGAGNRVVTGQTTSSDYPSTAGSYQETNNGGVDAFVTKVHGSGEFLAWSTFLGGGGGDFGRALAIDECQNVVVAGATTSSDFATTPEGYDGSFNGTIDAFLVRFGPMGGVLHYGSYLGGTFQDWAYTLALDHAGGLILAGSTESSDFPSTAGAYDETFSGTADAFVCRLPVAGEAVWTDVTSGPLGDPGLGRGAAWGDYDDDGYLDLYVANGEGHSNRLLWNDGLGGFADSTSALLADTSGNSHQAVWGDYDNDGDLDLYLADWQSPRKLFRNLGDGDFEDATAGDLVGSGANHSAAWGDYNNDGLVDLYLGNTHEANMLLQNVGRVTFYDVTSGPLGDTGYATGLAWGDYDNDGDLDLYLAMRNGPNKLLRNDGEGVFVDVTGGPLGDSGESMGVAWGDYDNDGDLDLYMSTENGPNKLFRNDGGDVFTDATSGPLGDAGPGQGVAWGDYDNDGDLDLYLANFGTSRLFRNDGDGEFVDVASGPLLDPGDWNAAVWGDYDNDGRLDLYITNHSSTNKLVRNDVSCGNHWLHIDLVGVLSNRAGIGARVRVVTGERSQIREVSAGSGLLSQNSLTVEFGLAAAATADSVIVRWPRSVAQESLQVVLDVPADQRLVIVEDLSTIDVETQMLFPGRYALHPNSPNPFNPATTIRFSLPQVAPVRLMVFDVAGRRVRELLDAEDLAPGMHIVTWDGRDDRQRPVGSGVYFYRMQAGEFVGTRQMVLLK